jgi:hypothetical protein
MNKNFNIGPGGIVSRNPDLVSASLDGEVVLMSIARGNYYGMDAVGSRIWELLENPLPFSGLMTALVREYEGKHARIQADLTAFLEELSNEGLVMIEKGGTAS